ncbi:MAG: hypothetical protein IJC84_04010, partial [Clostridia bacterium]|nr:hypothetical protein [Clostridia bacterium]
EKSFLPAPSSKTFSILLLNLAFAKQKATTTFAKQIFHIAERQYFIRAADFSARCAISLKKGTCALFLSLQPPSRCGT